jgi:hypothetical protein
MSLLRLGFDVLTNYEDDKATQSLGNEEVLSIANDKDRAPNPHQRALSGPVFLRGKGYFTIIASIAFDTLNLAESHIRPRS